jgi:hypothetical protein
VRVRLLGDGPVVEEFRLPLGLAAGCVFSVAQCWLIWSLLADISGAVSCRVHCSRVLFVCEGVLFCRVMYNCFFS